MAWRQPESHLFPTDERADVYLVTKRSPCLRCDGRGFVPADGMGMIPLMGNCPDCRGRRYFETAVPLEVAIEAIQENRVARDGQ